MATLRDKMWDLMRQVQNDLKSAVVQAETSEKYQDYSNALQQLRQAERLTRAVRSHIRAKMRKALPIFQESCPHTEQRDSVVRQTGDVRFVKVKVCCTCSKSFAQAEKVS